MAGQQPQQQHVHNQPPQNQPPPQQQAFAQHQQAPPQHHVAAPHRPKDDSIVEALTDIHFTKFATPKLLSITYVIILGLIGLWALGMIFAVISSEDFSGFLKLIFIIAVIFIGLLIVLLSRMSLETLAVFQRQRQLLEQISHKLDR